jgi:hypothetical protein
MFTKSRHSLDLVNIGFCLLLVPNVDYSQHRFLFTPSVNKTIAFYAIVQLFEYIYIYIQIR